MVRLRLPIFITVIAAISYACESGTEPELELRVEVLSGRAQTGDVGAPLAMPVRVRVAGPDGRTVGGVELAFEVIEGGGVVAGASTGRGAGEVAGTSATRTAGLPARVSEAVNVVTDGAGEAAVRWTLGPVAGEQRILARLARGGQVGHQAAVIALARPGPPALLVPLSGLDQMGLLGENLPEPFKVRVFDRFDNSIPGAEVRWQVASGGGSVTTSKTRADETAVATNTLKLGTSSGIHSVRAEAQQTGVTLSAFALTAIIRDGPGDTFRNDGSITMHDIVQFGTGIIGGGLFIRFVFDDTITSALIANPGSLVGVIDLDTDRNPGTGDESTVDAIRYDLGDSDIGVDAFVRMTTDDTGVYIVFTRVGDEFVPSGAITPIFKGSTLTLNIPLNMIASDGNLNLAAAVGSPSQWSDIVPNDGHIKVTR